MILTNFTPSPRVLYLAMELDSRSWKLGFSTAAAEPMRRRTVPAGNLLALGEEMERAIRRFFGASRPAEIVSCYEAGRDGFWIHRWMTENPLRVEGDSIPIRNLVIDPSSLSVSRQARRAKTDSIDLGTLMTHLVRWNEGEPKVWRVARVPSREDEAARLLEREIETIHKDTTRERNRLSSMLKLHGVSRTLSKIADIDRLRTPDGRALPPEFCDQLRRGLERIAVLRSQRRQLEGERARRVKEDRSGAGDQVRKLMGLRGIGEVGAAVLVREMFGWRDFENRKQVASAAGLCPTPYSSGGSEREQGISRAGNRRVRRVANQLAWIWIRTQTESSLTKWFRERFANAGPRGRKIGITAVSRKLLVQLWRFLNTGLIPPGASLKAT